MDKVQENKTVYVRYTPPSKSYSVEQHFVFHKSIKFVQLSPLLSSLHFTFWYLICRWYFKRPAL